MRVDPFYVVNLSSALDQTQTTQEQLSEELSSGLRVTSIGSDPVAAAQNVQLLNNIQQDDSFSQTTSLTQGMLQVTDSALGSVVTQLNQAISLATEANNGTLNASDLKSISNEIAGIRDEVLSLANSNYQGQYIFGGSQTGTAPFTLNNSTSPATVTYNGDSDVNTLVSPTGQSIQLNLPGDQVFTSAVANVFQTLNNLVTRLCQRREWGCRYDCFEQRIEPGEPAEGHDRRLDYAAERCFGSGDRGCHATDCGSDESDAG